MICLSPRPRTDVTSLYHHWLLSRVLNWASDSGTQAFMQAFYFLSNTPSLPCNNQNHMQVCHSWHYSNLAWSSTSPVKDWSQRRGLRAASQALNHETDVWCACVSCVNSADSFCFPPLHLLNVSPMQNAFVASIFSLVL